MVVFWCIGYESSQVSMVSITADAILHKESRRLYRHPSSIHGTFAPVCDVSNSHQSICDTPTPFGRSPPDVRLRHGGVGTVGRRGNLGQTAKTLRTKISTRSLGAL